MKKFFVFGLFIFLLACSEARLLPTEEKLVETPITWSASGDFCTSRPIPTTVDAKFLFIVDQSKSNSIGHETDPGGVKRHTIVDNIVTHLYSQLEEIHFGLITFPYNESFEAAAKTNAGLIFDPRFLKDPFLIQGHIDSLLSPPDELSTPFLPAIELSKKGLSEDFEMTTNQTYYHIFFISDGGSDEQHLPDILNGISNTLNVAPGLIKFHTVIYGQYSENAPVIMEEMAQVGGGQFYNFNEQTQFDLSDQLWPQKMDPYVFKEFLVYNLNAATCFDGTQDADSDMDGLCDKDEIQMGSLGFNPKNRFSFNDGYGDVFHWRRIKFGESLLNCFDRTDYDRDLLTNCEENAIFSRSRSSNSYSLAQQLDPDSDNDGIIDGLEAMIYFQHTFDVVLDPMNTFQNILDPELIPDLQQIKEHRSPLVLDQDSEKYDTILKWKGVNESGQSCYGFQQQTLPVFPTNEIGIGQTLMGMEHRKNENLIMVYFLEALASKSQSQFSLRSQIQRIDFMNPGHIRVEL